MLQTQLVILVVVAIEEKKIPEHDDVPGGVGTVRGAVKQLNVKSLTRSCTRQSYRSMNFSDILKHFYLRHDAEYVNMLSQSFLL